MGGKTIDVAIGSQHNNGSPGLYSFLENFDNIMIFNTEVLAARISEYWNSGDGISRITTTYSKFDFALDAINSDSKGQIPIVSLRVNNITQFLEPYLKDTDGAVGSTVKLTVINSDYLSVDYAETVLTWDVIDTTSTDRWVTFELGGPNPLRKGFPFSRFLADHCRFAFNDVEEQDGYECGYTGKAIEGITLSGTDPISVNITGHNWLSGDEMKFWGVGGATELNGNSYTVTKTDADNFTLNSTDSSNFTAWTSAGVAGFSDCLRIISDCRDRGRTVQYGGFLSMREGGVKLA